MQTIQQALKRADTVLRAIDEKAADLDQLRWQAAAALTDAVDAGADFDAIAAELGRKRADVVSYVTTWRAYGADSRVRSEQTYSGLQRLVRRYPDDPAARQAIIDQARAERCSVATVMDHQGYRGQSGGRKGGSSHRPEDSMIKQLMALGAPVDVTEAWYGLDAALSHFTNLADTDAVLPPEVVRMIKGRLFAVQRAWAKVEGQSQLAAMANGEAF